MMGHWAHKEVWRYVQPSGYNTAMWQTDRWTDTRRQQRPRLRIVSRSNESQFQLCVKRLQWFQWTTFSTVPVIDLSLVVTACMSSCRCFDFLSVTHHNNETVQQQQTQTSLTNNMTRPSSNNICNQFTSHGNSDTAVLSAKTRTFLCSWQLQQQHTYIYYFYILLNMTMRVVVTNTDMIMLVLPLAFFVCKSDILQCVTWIIHSYLGSLQLFVLHWQYYVREQPWFNGHWSRC